MVTNFLKKYFPGTARFSEGFFNAMDNNSGPYSQSLRKWLAVGFFWLCASLAFKYTDKDNLSVVLGIFTAMITSLVITYTVGNISEKKIDNNPKPTSETKPAPDEGV
jgi:hypothetical protein